MRERSYFLMILLMVPLLGLATPTHAQELSLEGNFAGINITDRNHRALTSRGGAAGVGINLGLELSQAPGLRFLAGYGSDGAIGYRFNRDVEYSWGRNRVMVGADYGVDLLGGALRPLIRAQGGYSAQSLLLRADGVAYSDWDHGLSGLVAGGFEVSLGRRTPLMRTGFFSRFSVGANFLAGYLWQSRAHFDEMRSDRLPDAEDPWVRGSYDAGELGGSGWYFSLGAMVRYRFGS